MQGCAQALLVRTVPELGGPLPSPNGESEERGGMVGEMWG